MVRVVRTCLTTFDQHSQWSWVNAHAWWSNSTGLEPAIHSVPKYTLELEQGQEQEQEQLLVVNLGDAISPQVQVEPLDGHLQIDGDMVKAHAKMVCQVAEEIQNPT